MDAAQGFIATSIEFMVALFIFFVGLMLLVVLIFISWMSPKPERHF